MTHTKILSPPSKIGGEKARRILLEKSKAKYLKSLLKIMNVMPALIIEKK